MINFHSNNYLEVKFQVNSRIWPLFAQFQVFSRPPGKISKFQAFQGFQVPVGTLCKTIILLNVEEFVYMSRLPLVQTLQLFIKMLLKRLQVL